MAAASWFLVYLYTGHDNNIGNSGIASNTKATVIIIVGVLQYGSIVNILLGGFNLIPAFPLDGGRLLRSALLSWKKDYDQSPKIAARVGIAISYGFMAFGFLSNAFWLVYGWNMDLAYRMVLK